MNEFTRTIINGLKTYIQKSRGNWNQNDETAIDYIKNRTHWVKNKTLFTLTLDENTTVHNQYSDIEAQGYNYEQVNLSAWEFTKNIGAINLKELIGGELRFRRKKYDAGLGRYTETESLTLQITSDYISNDTLFVQGILRLTSLGDLTLFCEGGADSKLPWNYPTSLEGLDIKRIDPMFISIPNDNILNGSAEGSVRTIGANNKIGEYAFAEGVWTTASGYASHAEGVETVASESVAHAEGDFTLASGYASHAEGIETVASGPGSHAEGLCTTASGEFQHVQGAFNIEDTENKYAHIVGNGDYDTLSNAHTLDWDGNAWFAGDVYVGGASQNDVNSNKVATEKELALPRNYFALTDIDNGYTYIIQMKNGNLVSRHSVSSIEVTTMPNKIEYYAGEYFDDPTGMIVTATCADGSVIEITNYTCSNNRFAIGENTVTISYNEAGSTYTTTININAVEFDAATILIDFDYIANDDWTYTLTNWKQTLNGEPSTKMVIPDYSVIRL